MRPEPPERSRLAQRRDLTLWQPGDLSTLSERCASRGSSSSRIIAVRLDGRDAGTRSGTSAYAPAQSPVPRAVAKGAVGTTRASGPFEVKLTPQAAGDEAESATYTLAEAP